MAGLDTTYVPYKANPNALAISSPGSSTSSPSTRPGPSPAKERLRAHPGRDHRQALGRPAEVPTMQEAGFKTTT